MVTSDSAPDRPSTTQVDEELSQAKARVGVCVFALLYLLGWWMFSSPVRPLTLTVLLAYTGLSIVWLGWVKGKPGNIPWRRIPIIFGDLGVNSFFMHMLLAKGAFFYPMYLWIIVGNGVRFGSRYLLLAMGVGVSLFAPMLIWNDYWRANLVAGSGLLAGLVVLPLFYLSLIRRLHRTQLELQAEVERSRLATEAKTEFLANMSHELRTPMNGVIGVVDLMRSTTLDAQQRTHLDLIQRSADSLLMIIDDVLEYSRIDAGKLSLEPTPFDLHSLVEDVVDLLRPGADAKGLALSLHFHNRGGRSYVGDATRLRQVLVNLTGNAVKFTERGSIRLEVFEEFSAGDRAPVRITVTDTGIGISPEQQEHVFQKFEQAESRLRSAAGGSGLGLAISRHLAQMMGGDITLESSPGQGSTFTVAIRLEVSDLTIPMPILREARPSTSEDPIEILVVEDNPVNQLVVCGFLDRLGLPSDVADDGEEALERVAAKSYDLILLDVQLPKLDGLEVCRRIRAAEGPDEHVPIVALTANASVEDRTACLEAGMDLHLRKPLMNAALENAFQELAQRGLLRYESLSMD